MKVNIKPRKPTDKGGVACMPLLKNVPVGHPEWELTTCPACGAKCWKQPDIDIMIRTHGVIARCTMCALKGNM